MESVILIVIISTKSDEDHEPVIFVDGWNPNGILLLMVNSTVCVGYDHVMNADKDTRFLQIF